MLCFILVFLGIARGGVDSSNGRFSCTRSSTSWTSTPSWGSRHWCVSRPAPWGSWSRSSLTRGSGHRAVMDRFFSGSRRKPRKGISRSRTCARTHLYFRKYFEIKVIKNRFLLGRFFVYLYYLLYSKVFIHKNFLRKLNNLLKYAMVIE